jgi:DtxR family Mn-dependent transcriptional regulator
MRLFLRDASWIIAKLPDHCCGMSLSRCWRRTLATDVRVRIRDCARRLVIKCSQKRNPVEVMMITISKENYLKAIAEAEAEGKTVISALLAHWLSVTPPAVTAALKRLRRDGLVTIMSGRIELTSEGRKVAERTILRHHLIERMLSEVFGMEWVEVHEEAERLEHAVSQAFEKKLVKVLGHKETCPHGNGLAVMNPEQRRRKGQRLLSEAEAGLTYRVFSVYERDRKLLEFLEERGIRPGTHLKIESRNYDGTAILKVERKRIALGSPAAEKIWVAREH